MKSFETRQIGSPGFKIKIKIQKQIIDRCIDLCFKINGQMDSSQKSFYMFINVLKSVELMSVLKKIFNQRMSGTYWRSLEDVQRVWNSKQDMK